MHKVLQASSQEVSATDASASASCSSDGSRPQHYGGENPASNNPTTKHKGKQHTSARKHHPAASGVGKGDAHDLSRVINGNVDAPRPMDDEERPMSAVASSAGPQSTTPGSRNPGARGTFVSANHLLNFQYDQASRGGRAQGGRGSGQRPQSGPGGRGAKRNQYAQKPQKYDKNKFLQANFRFLVSDAVDVPRFLEDPDRMFDWEDVVQVEMMTATPVQCPISLDSPPLCPQITTCGHIFSFPSIMQHMVNHGGENLRRSAPCPLCFAPIVARELRLVTIRSVKTACIGDTVEFK
eukprot:CAMPEP_0202923498 /NCGR_PEP_ID=MMETSP1392-20130828/78481_1 /ASSEMBLY_ACC=CAM_ASM_000868 /TAXON_ID=225041 /ORGANISM="Chlamydomonas chlamydogama, Strain SAG 11-48b" /LENGTH=294 /DNA_ID=CAMNT_0049617181 /DNA_START=112 /DNA_END=993 /DNA_ORIENTATION=-